MYQIERQYENDKGELQVLNPNTMGCGIGKGSPSLLIHAWIPENLSSSYHVKSYAQSTADQGSNLVIQVLLLGSSRHIDWLDWLAVPIFII
jgi:hypothetical protein